jgi:putative glutamine amidotransferase
MKIGITDTAKEDSFKHYVDWLQSVERALEVVKLSYQNGTDGELAGIDGLLLTGGGDVHPKFYGKQKEIDKAKRMNEKRDEFEFKLVDYALDVPLPILGVCRGMQTINVFLGGSLVTDLVSAGFDDHTSPENGTTKHRLSILPHSTLCALTGKEEIEVNSYHHQAIERLGRGLVASAFSRDGVLEAAEWAIKDRMPFLAAVQWHPERTKEEIVSQKLARVFLREVHHRSTINSH